MAPMVSRRLEVVFQPEGRRVTVADGVSLLDAAMLAGVDIISTCGGAGTCGKCKVVIDERREGAGPLTEAERSELSADELTAGYRLACLATVLAPLTVKVPPESKTGTQRLQLEGVETPVEPDPLVKKFLLKVPRPTLEDQRSDVDRMLDELSSRHGLSRLRVDYDLIKRLPPLLREGEWSVTAIVWGGEVVVGVEPGDTSGRCFGYAVDIGTTKLAGYLLDLGTGRVLAASALSNPQIPYGEDVLSRIGYATREPEGLEKLQGAVASGVNKILREVCAKADVLPEEVYEMTVVGNTAMHHLFLKLPVRQLALSPYVQAVSRGLDIPARELGVEINSNGNVHALPVIAGFVGGDCTAVILATEIDRRSELCLALDIGTNTEVVLGNREGMLACSCASGPAFEGMHIRHGMRAETGAIERVEIDPGTLEVRYSTIGGADPRGICGSGLVDAVAGMLKSGIVDVSGRMKEGLASKRMRRGDSGLEFVLAEEGETPVAGGIVLTQKDVRELQLAKGAIHTGTATLLRKRGVTEGDVDVVFIAGAFGSYIDPVSARLIGLYPELELGRVRVVGNAAGTGARMALVSKAARERAEEIARRVEYVELAAEPSFQTEFLNSLYLPHADLTRYPEASELLRKTVGRFEEPVPFK